MKDRKGYRRITLTNGSIIHFPINAKEPAKWKPLNDKPVWGKIGDWKDEAIQWHIDQRGLAELAQSKGTAAAGKNRTQSAADYWKPYQDEYHRLRSEGMKPGKARYEILKQIRANGSWKKRENKPEPSQNTLDTWLKD